MWQETEYHQIRFSAVGKDILMLKKSRKVFQFSKNLGRPVQKSLHHKVQQEFSNVSRTHTPNTSN